MAKQLKFLSPASEEVVRKVVHNELGRRKNSAHKKYAPDDPRAPDTYFIKLPTGGLAARDVTTGAVTRTLCDICEIHDNNDGTWTLQAKTGADQIYVFNPWPVKWYYSSAGDTFLTVRREKTGLWFCEKPKYRTKAKPDAAMTPGGTGVTTSVWSNGGDTGDNVTAYLNWMAGGQNVSAGKEIIIEYYEDERKWIVVEAACE